MNKKCCLLIHAGAIILFASTFVSSAAEIRREEVKFAKGASQAEVKGSIKGDQTVDYAVRAGAGQTMTVAVTPTHGATYFNVLAPGAGDVAMHVGQDGKGYTGMLPIEGEYRVRVYLIRAAARRGESSNYLVTIRVTGKALAPLAASKDAMIPGTPFHASTTIACVPPYQSSSQKCEAFVIRRGRDTTGTVEVRVPGAQSAPRRILFVGGKPKASDATEKMTYTRKGELMVVRIGTSESYEIPEILLAGG